MEYNVLILSAGRRVELVQCFQDAVKKLNIKAKIIAADCSNTAPALYFADDKVILPRISEGNYTKSIIDCCNKFDIKLIVPTIDTELKLLSKDKTLIEKESKAKVLISNEEVINICRDKINTDNFLRTNNFGVPKLYSKEEIENNKIKYPCFIKPISGSSSIGAYKVNDEKEFKSYSSVLDDYMLQDLMVGEEYTVDVFLDFDSKIITITPRIRLATRGGEILKGRIVKDKEIINDVTKLMNTLKPIGHITVQLMKTKNGIEYIEINPRFGGGAPMSIMAGANSCINLFKLLNNEKLNYNEDYNDNVNFFRFDQCVMVKEDDLYE
ncbi:MAG: ATP-grasp domain-containing protein [bacterium]